MKIKEILQFKFINKLKSVYRISSVNSRKESSAEHSWSCMILADFILSRTTEKIDRTRVYELLMYHDLVEIKSGDVPLDPNNGYCAITKNNKEMKAANDIRNHLPSDIGEKFYTRFIEFEEQKTPEAKFAKAIDALDAEIHELDYKEDWNGWSEEFLREKKEKLMHLPILKETFEELINYLIDNEYIVKKSKKN